MSWIRRPALALFLIALLLRGGLAILTSYKPLLPDYYFTDAAYADQLASEILQAWQEGKRYVPPVSPAKRLHAVLLARLYAAVGFKPLVAKLANALIGAAAVVVFFWIGALVVGPRAGLLAAGAVALWPSHVFMTSQNFKDGPVMLCAFAALWCFLAALRAASWRAFAMASAAGMTGLALIGLQRAYLMTVLAASVAAAAALAVPFRVRRGALYGRTLLCGLAAVLALLIHRPVATALFQGPLRQSAGPDEAGMTAAPAAVDDSAVAAPALPRWSPRGLSEMRRSQQVSDQAWSQIYKGRRVGTQLFYGIEFRTWLDVAIFLPQGAFHVLFMPLPGLFPMEGNTGRLMASMENLFLLVLALAGLAAAVLGPKTAERGVLLGFFCLMTAGSALLEFDLGSAARHKTLYAAMLFPFAFSLIAERRSPGRGKRRVFEILECGGPGGTGNQVAAICNGLDPAQFETTLVYAVRGGKPQDYRNLARGAAAAFFIPAMVREISPAKDLKALLALYRLLRREAPDVVHAHSSKAGALGRVAAWLTGTPLIFYSPRGYGFLQLDRPWISRQLYWLLERSVSWIGEIVAVSPSERRLARRLSWGRPVRTVPDPFLGSIREKPPRASDGVVLGACGRLTYARNPEAFLRLAQALRRLRPDVRCVWIGGGEQEAAVRGRLKKVGLGDSVEITGWLESRPALERLAGVDVFVHYSRWEGLPNAVLEAMALGLPVVASDIPGNRDAVLHGRTGLIVKDELELLEGALKLAQDPALRLKLGAAGRERVLKDFSPSAAFASLAKLYSRPS